MGVSPLSIDRRLGGMGPARPGGRRATPDNALSKCQRFVTQSSRAQALSVGHPAQRLWVSPGATGTRPAEGVHNARIFAMPWISSISQSLRIEKASGGDLSTT